MERDGGSEGWELGRERGLRRKGGVEGEFMEREGWGLGRKLGVEGGVEGGSE